MDQNLANLDLAVSEPVPVLDPILGCVLQRVRLLARRRAAWLRKLWGEEGQPRKHNTITHPEIDTHLEDRDAPEAEAAWYAGDRTIARLNDVLAQIEAKMDADDDSRFAQLHRIFDIEPKDSDLLQACLGMVLDPSLRRIYAYLQDHAGRPNVTAELAARLFGHGREGAWSPLSPLFRWELLTKREIAPGEPPMIICDPLISDWVLGESRLDEPLIDIASFKAPAEPLSGWPVKETVDFLTRRLQGDHTGDVRVTTAGPAGSGRRTLAAAVGNKMDVPVLVVNSDPIEDADWQRKFLRVQRQAFLDGCAVAWHGEKAVKQVWPQVVPWFPVQFIVCEPDKRLKPIQGVTDHRIEMPNLSLDERGRLWKKLLPVSVSWSQDAFNSLVAQYRVTVGEIAAVAQAKIDRADKATEFIREARRNRLGKLAQRIECTFNWDDLVVNDNLKGALEDLVFEAGVRADFWERPEAQRLFPQGRGLIGLFSGPSGTGKTMAAQVIAAELKLDLFRIDLSAVVSKYVGETSQNLERILSPAAQMDVVLLFDEADALFGKRTEIRDAHDRFANTDTGYLLQAIENYPGVALLATNQKANIDPAFIRRLRYVLEFSKPDEAQRLAIWQRIVGELAGTERQDRLAGGLRRLSEAMEITGAQIKFAVLAGVFAAKKDGKPLGMAHLLTGLERELMKEGRALSNRERERLLSHG